MFKSNKRYLFLILALALFLGACSGNFSGESVVESEEREILEEPVAKAVLGDRLQDEEKPYSEDDLSSSQDLDSNYLDEDGHYTSKEDVGLYISIYGKLPKNYITKKEARDLGWVAKEGNLFQVTDGKSIGGDYFGNREGRLPAKKGRKYFECDIDYDGGRRGAKRIVFSNDGLVYYTGDHYESFELLYGDE